jgi:hypothetical protein
MIALFRRLVACLLIVSLPAQAGLVSTENVSAAGSRDRIAVFLDRADVQSRLESFGVSPSEVKARVAALSDVEAAQLAGKIDSLPAGGDAGVGGVLGLVVLVFIILLITDILGLTKIFPFTRSVR